VGVGIDALEAGFRGAAREGGGEGKEEVAPSGA
jgi:hypothetical protein